MNIKSKEVEFRDAEKELVKISAILADISNQTKDVSQQVGRMAHIWQIVRLYDRTDHAWGRLIYVDVSLRWSCRSSTGCSVVLPMRCPIFLCRRVVLKTAKDYIATLAHSNLL